MEDCEADTVAYKIRQPTRNPPATSTPSVSHPSNFQTDSTTVLRQKYGSLSHPIAIISSCSYA